MRAVILGLSALSAVCAAGLGVLQAADAVPVTIAVLRGDGVLIPIVTRSGTKWAHTWPVPVKSVDVPLGLDGIPKRWWGKAGPTTTWHTWQIDGTITDTVAEQPTWYLAHCQQGVGLKTSITGRPPIPPPTLQPYPKLGLASSVAVPFGRIEAIDERAPIWMPVVDAMTTAVNTAETAMGGPPVMDVGGGRPKHPIPADQRAKVPVRVEALYRMPLARDRFLYYVETTKRYGMPPIPAGRTAPDPSPRKDGCGTMTFANAWFVSGAGGPIATPPVIDDVRVSTCDYGDVQLMLPLGYIADGTNRIWIAQIAGWANENYQVFRWDADKRLPVALYQTHGGWCAPEQGG